ncbi:MAG: phosphonoacetaldehyde reductase [Zavarzinella sp.]
MPFNHLPAILHEVGCLQQLPAMIDPQRQFRVLVIADRHAYDLTGAAELFGSYFPASHLAHFHDFEPNPKYQDVQRGTASFQAFQPDLVLAFGGGSAIDVAKVIARYAALGDQLAAHIRGEIPFTPSGPPLIAIPTTAGTGSEATHFAVIYLDGAKYSLAHPNLLPTMVVLDASLTAQLPPGITSASGLDALCQALESLWAVGGTPESAEYARQAAHLAWAHLENAVCHSTMEDRQAMLSAAHLAGKAINIGKTTGPHAFSYALTSKFGVPHGWAVAMVFSTFLRFNAQVGPHDCLHPGGVAKIHQSITEIVQILGAKDVDQACAVWEQLLQRVQCPTRLSQVGVSAGDLPMLLDAVNPERVANNPRRLQVGALLPLLMNMF